MKKQFEYGKMRAEAASQAQQEVEKEQKKRQLQDAKMRAEAASQAKKEAKREKQRLAEKKRKDEELFAELRTEFKKKNRGLIQDCVI